MILLRSPAKAPTALLLIALAQPAFANRASTETIAALPSSVTSGVGAPLSFVEYEAENVVSHGRIVGPDRTFGTLAAEASGRRAVLLESAQDFVEFTLAKPANGVSPNAKNAPALPPRPSARRRAFPLPDCRFFFPECFPAISPNPSVS